MTGFVRKTDGQDDVMATDVNELQVAIENLNSGWVLVDDTWTYASATTITVPSGAASIYSVGDKIRIKQGGSYKYFYIVTVADALLTVNGGTDYTVANAAITDVYYSKAASPVGFPQFFNYTPTGTNISGGAYTIAKFDISEGKCMTVIKYTCAGADISGDVSFSLPVLPVGFSGANPAASITFHDANGNIYVGFGWVSNATQALTLRVINAASTYSALGSLSSTIPFTWAAGDIIFAVVNYSIQ